MAAGIVKLTLAATVACTHAWCSMVHQSCGYGPARLTVLKLSANDVLLRRASGCQDWRRAIAASVAAVVLLAGASVMLPNPSAAQANQPERSAGGDGDEATFRAEELVIGAASAPVTVVEYLSVTCTHCAAFERDTWPQVRSRLIAPGRVRFIIREMPTAPVAVSAAGFLLARCRGEPGYWQTVERLLQEQARILAAKSVDEAVHVEAAIAGLGETETRLCLSDPESLDAVNARRQAGLGQNVDSTPFFLIDGSPLRPGTRLAGGVYAGGELTYAQLAAAVDASARGR